MAFVGYDQSGIPVFEFISDVPQFYLDEGRRFSMLNDGIPFTPVAGDSYGVSAQSPGAWAIIRALLPTIQWVIRLAIVYLITNAIVEASRAAATVAQAAQARPIDADGDGVIDAIDSNCCLYQLDDTTGKLVKVDPTCPGCPRFDIGAILTAGAVLIGVGAGAYVAILLAPRLLRRRRRD